MAKNRRPVLICSINFDKCSTEQIHKLIADGIVAKEEVDAHYGHKSWCDRDKIIHVDFTNKRRVA